MFYLTRTHPRITYYRYEFITPMNGEGKKKLVLMESLEIAYLDNLTPKYGAKTQRSYTVEVTIFKN